MSGDWKPLLPFYVRVKEGSPDTGPPFLEVDETTTLEDGRQVSLHLVPKYKDDYRTKEGYHRCFRHAEHVRDLLNDEIERIGIMAFRPGQVIRRR